MLGVVLHEQQDDHFDLPHRYRSRRSGLRYHAGGLEAPGRSAGSGCWEDQCHGNARRREPLRFEIVIPGRYVRLIDVNSVLTRHLYFASSVRLARFLVAKVNIQLWTCRVKFAVLIVYGRCDSSVEGAATHATMIPCVHCVTNALYMEQFYCLRSSVSSLKTKTYQGQGCSGRSHVSSFGLTCRGGIVERARIKLDLEALHDSPSSSVVHRSSKHAIKYSCL